MDIKDVKSARAFIQAWSRESPAARSIMARIAAEGQRSCASIARSQGNYEQEENYSRAAAVLERVVNA